MTVLIVVFFKGVEYSWFWLLLEQSQKAFSIKRRVYIGPGPGVPQKICPCLHKRQQSVHFQHSCSMVQSNGWNFLLIVHSHNSSACWDCATLQSNCSCLNLTDPLCSCPLCLYTILTNSQPRSPCGRSRFSVLSTCYLPVCSISGPEWYKGKGKHGGSLSVPPADSQYGEGMYLILQQELNWEHGM